MKVTEIKEIIQTLYNRINQVGFENFSKGIWTSDNSLLSDVFAAYKQIYRKEFNASCRSCYMDCWMKLYNLFKNESEMEAMEARHYRMKKNTILYGNAIGLNPNFNITDFNATDELAELYLRKNKDYINYFYEFPADWQERIEAYNENTKKQEIKEKEKTEYAEFLEKLTRKELLALAKEKNVADKNTIKLTNEALKSLLLNKSE